MNFAQRILELREEKEPKLTQTELAKALKITQRKISYLETNKVEPNIEDIKEYCKYFNVSADYILGLTDDKRKYW